MTKGIGLAATLLLVMPAAEVRAQMGIAQGRIVDENDDPVAGATVDFEFRGGVNRQYTAETDENGKYTQIVTAGPYRITASKEGYQGGFMEQTVNAGAPTRLPDIQLVSRDSLMEAAMAPIIEKFEKAAALSQAGKLDEAAAVFRELAEENPDIPEVHFNLGTIYARQENWAEAEAAFQETLALQPEHVQAALSLAGVYESLERPEEAVAVLEEVAAAHPEDARVLYNLGILYTNQRRAEEAYATLQKVAELDPDNVEVHYVLGTLALNQGETGKAVTYLETYLQRAPEDAPYRATATDLLGKLQEALAQQSQ